jgi:hypothetical protein
VVNRGRRLGDGDSCEQRRRRGVGWKCNPSQPAMTTTSRGRTRGCSTKFQKLEIIWERDFLAWNATRAEKRRSGERN